MNFPITKTKEERKDFANQILGQLQNKYKDDLLAVAIYGSVGRDEDTEYSDIEMIAIVKGQGIEENYENLYRGLKYEVEVISEDIGIKEITDIEINWSLVVGIYLKNKILLDNDGVFERYKKLYEKVIAGNINEGIRKIFVDDIYEQTSKFLNASKYGSKEQIRFLAMHLFQKMIGFMGVINKSYYLSASTRAEQAMAFPINFPSFQKLGSIILSGNLIDTVELTNIVTSLLQEMLDYVKENNIGVDFEGVKINDILL